MKRDAFAYGHELKEKVNALNGNADLRRHRAQQDLEKLANRYAKKEGAWKGWWDFMADR